jgi:hypothetical protein
MAHGTMARESPLVAFVLALSTTAIAAPHLEIKGTSHFEARSLPGHGGAQVEGTLLDDADRPIATDTLTVFFVTATGAGLPIRGCDNGGLPPGRLPSMRATKRDGRFCVRADAAPGTTRVVLEWPGTADLTGVRTELSVDATRQSVALAFDPDPRIMMVGQGAVTLDAVARLETDQESPSAAGITLRLTDERGVVLGEEPTDRNGRAHFTVLEASLGPAGPCELRLSFDGNETDAPTNTMTPCERHEEVRVTAPGPAGTRVLTGVEEEDGVGLDFDVQTARGARVASGSVEVAGGGPRVSVGPVSEGHAHVAVRLDGAAHEISVRYVADAPWLVASAPRTLSVEVRRTIVWKRTLVVFGGLTLLAWFFVARSRLFAPRAAPVTDSGPAKATGEARIEVVAQRQTHEAGWEGRIIDAHDEKAVPFATVTLERPGFASLEVLTRTTADASGRFTLGGQGARQGDQIAAEGALHGRLVKPVPPSAVLEIALMSRRRALLRRLAHWAKHRGAPFEVAPEATPGHVNRVAGGDAQTALWALATQEAAFGARDVDAAVETEVGRLGHREGDAPAPRKGSPAS